MVTINRNIEAVSDTKRQVGLHIHADKTTYVFMLHYQNTRQIQITNAQKIWLSSNILELYNKLKLYSCGN
jgi:hypothetical protein